MLSFHGVSFEPQGRCNSRWGPRPSSFPPEGRPWGIGVERSCRELAWRQASRACEARTKCAELTSAPRTPCICSRGAMCLTTVLPCRHDFVVDERDADRPLRARGPPRRNAGVPARARHDCRGAWLPLDLDGGARRAVRRLWL